MSDIVLFLNVIVSLLWNANISNTVVQIGIEGIHMYTQFGNKQSEATYSALS